MPRPQRCRRVCNEPRFLCFEAESGDKKESIILSVDEYEVIRLVDFEKQSHEQCGLIMDISRTTVTEIYERARYKLADFIINGKQLIISGGNYKVCNGKQNLCLNKPCCKNTKAKKGSNIIMKIAVTYDNGNIFQHFGHTETFKVYQVENGVIVSSEVVSSNGNGHGALAGVLNELGVDVLICGGIGAGAQNALAGVGIKLYGGVTGNADEAVNAFLNERLSYNPNVKCNHHSHEEGHSCGNHGCGGHSCH